MAAGPTDGGIHARRVMHVRSSETPFETTVAPKLRVKIDGHDDGSVRGWRRAARARPARATRGRPAGRPGRHLGVENHRVGDHPKAPRGDGLEGFGRAVVPAAAAP